ncbi:MAG: hypothetical protein HQL31_00185 [Planctomycetes bacterium]|nr:hypothetical protein [Planctomycetota bacterium]
MIRLWRYAAVLGFGLAMAAIGLLFRPGDISMGIIQGRSFMYDESLARLQKSYDKHPNNLTVILEMARLHNILGLPEKEIFFLKRYLEIKPKDVTLRKELAKVYIWNMQTSAGREQYEILHRQVPEDTEVLHKLARSYSWEQRSQEAIACYLKLQKLEAMSLEDYQALIGLYAGAHNLEATLPLFEVIWKMAPQDLASQDYVDRANIYRWLNREAEAVTIMEEMLAHWPGDSGVRQVYADWFVAGGRIDHALERLKGWAQNEKGESRSALENKLVNICQRSGKTDVAISLLRKIAAENRADEQQLVLLFWLQADGKDYAGVVQYSAYLSSALMEREGMMATLAEALDKSGKRAEAIATWEKILISRPQEDSVREQLMWVYLDGHQVEAARGHLNILLQRFPDKVEYLQASLSLQMEEKHYTKVVALALRGLDQQPESRFFLESLAEAEAALENWSASVSARRKLIALDPARADYLLSLIDALAEMGSREEAGTFLDEAWSRFSAEPSAAAKIARAYLRFEKPDKALVCLNILAGEPPKEEFREEIFDASADSGELVTAEKLMAELEAAGRMNAGHFGRLYDAYLSRGLWDEGLKLLETNTAIRLLGREERLGRKAEIFENSDRLSESVVILEELASSAGNAEPWRERLFERIPWLKDRKQAIAILNRQARPETEEMLSLAELLVADRQFSSAGNCLNQLGPVLRPSRRALEVDLELARQGKNAGKILALIDRLIAQTSEVGRQTDLLVERASLQYEEGDREDSLESYVRALALSPGNTALLRSAGHLAFDLERYDEVIAYLEGDRDLEDYDRFILGAAHMRAGRDRQGRKVLESLLRSLASRDDESRWSFELDIAYELGDEDRVNWVWEELVSRGPSARMMMRYALHLYYRGNETAAGFIYQGLEPEDSDAYRNLQKVVEPDLYRGPLSDDERLAMSSRLLQNRDWYSALLILNP